MSTKLVMMLRRSSAANEAKIDEKPRQRFGSLDSALGASSNQDDARSKGRVTSKLLSQWKLGRQNSMAQTSGTAAPTQKAASTSSADLLLALPNELHTQILLELELDSVLSLRLASRSFYSLVVSCESALVRAHSKHTLFPKELHLRPPPPPSQAELRWLLDLSHRRHVADKLTATLCNFVESEILRRNTVRKRREFRKTWQRLYRRMFPFVYMLEYFFDEHRRNLLERYISTANPNPGQKFQICIDVTADDRDEQTQIMERYDTEMLSDCYRVFRLMVQALERQLRPPTYATSMEKVLRGWTAKPASEQDMGTLLMIGGLSQVQRVMSIRTYNERCKAVESFIRSLSPLQTTRWKDAWVRLGVASSTINLDRVPTSRIIIPPLSFFVHHSALCLLVTKRAVNQPAIEGSLSLSTRDFISDLVGYDILLHSSPPAWVDTSDGDDGDGSDTDSDDMRDEGDGDTTGFVP